MYQPSPSIFQRLDDQGFVVIEDLRYYPYRATFDFECYFSDERLPSDSDKLQWSARHVPLSVSVASNVTGHEDAQCYVTNGDSDKLVEDMMAHLITLSIRQRQTSMVGTSRTVECERGFKCNGA